jgi:RsiW-degrading membrane proteinase PrsW (M82 family)
MTCSDCGREGPEGRYCTWCGRRQTAGDQPRGRGRYAAAPNESVLAPSLITTVFPHLAEPGVNEYRWALGLGLLALLGLWIAGLITAALIVAAILVPTIYVMYLYEARVYRDAPIPVTLATIGGGFIVGIVVTIAIGAVLGARPVVLPRGGVDIGSLLVATAVVPLVKEIIKPLPALLLRSRAEFSPSIDGLVFGIAAGLGFAAAETIVHFSAVITGLPAQSQPGQWIIPLVSVGVLTPLMHGSTTGLITAALWRLGRGPLHRLALPAIVVALVGHVAFAFGGQLLQVATSPIVELVWQGAVVVALLLTIRLVLDQLLREEATEFGLHQLPCPNCGADITAAGFCTVCGVALAATPHRAGEGVTPSRATTGGSR